MSYTLEFFADHRGRCHAREYLDQMAEVHRMKALKIMELLKEQGPLLKRPYADRLRDKISELRTGFATSEHRFLYFFAGKTIVITHGFLKKSNAVPSEHIDFAIRCMNEWRYRQGASGKKGESR